MADTNETRCPKTALDLTSTIPCESCNQAGRKLDLVKGQTLCRVCSKRALCHCCKRRVGRVVSMHYGPWHQLCLACDKHPRPVGPIVPTRAGWTGWGGGA